MKKVIIFTSIVAIFLFSFTLMNDVEGESEKVNTEQKSIKSETDLEAEIEVKLEDIEKLDFSKIKIANENPDFDAHAGLD